MWPDRGRTVSFLKDERGRRKILKRKRTTADIVECEKQERDGHATEALLRTLDDRGRSKGHRYRPACDALRTVASDVEGDRRSKSEREEWTTRRLEGEREHGRRSTKKRCVRRPSSRRLHFLTTQIQNVTRTRGRASPINRPSTARGWEL